MQKHGCRQQGTESWLTLGKPKSFDGTSDFWRQFKFTLFGFAGAVDTRLKQTMIEDAASVGTRLAMAKGC